MLIIGLGNVGIRYKNTLHNLGFMVVDELAKLFDRKILRLECSAMTTNFSIDGRQIVLAKPTTYMNLSGQAVKSLMTKYKKNIDDVVIIYDDIDLPKFSVRVRTNGSGGTHNGMKNIIQLINSHEFKRIRMGIGKADYQLADYVLSKINKADKKLFSQPIDQTAKLLYDYIYDQDFETVMREGNNIGK